MSTENLPRIALSIRQPWAWAIIAGHKNVENRSRFAVSKGRIECRQIAVHAAKGMTRAEYEAAADFMHRLGIKCPLPDLLVRGAIIGTVVVTRVVKKHFSPWFFGPCGLILENAVAIKPIPATGALGYFERHESGALVEPLPWMLAWPPKSEQKQPDLLEAAK